MCPHLLATGKAKNIPFFEKKFKKIFSYYNANSKGHKNTPDRFGPGYDAKYVFVPDYTECLFSHLNILQRRNIMLRIIAAMSFTVQTITEYKNTAVKVDADANTKIISIFSFLFI